VRAVDDGELAVEHFACAVSRSCQQPTFAGIAGANVHLQRRDRVGRDQFPSLLGASL